MMDGVKANSLNTFKAMVLVNSDFHKDFEKYVTLYKDFMNNSDSTPGEKRQVLEVSYGGCGGSGGEKVKYSYYSKEEYRNLSCDKKGKPNKISDKSGPKSGGGGSSEPRSKTGKLANQRKKDIFIIKELKENLGDINDGSNSEHEESKEEAKNRNNPALTHQRKGKGKGEHDRNSK